jgi:hypothetical protein
MDEGVVWGYSGANAGVYRKITSTSTTATTVILAFPRDTVVGDQFLVAPIYPTRSIVAQTTTNNTEIDATAAIATDVEMIVIEMLLNDISGQGLTQSYAYVQFADNLFGATIT